jgi:hypothetical protein
MLTEIESALCPVERPRSDSPSRDRALLPMVSMTHRHEKGFLNSDVISNESGVDPGNSWPIISPGVVDCR